MMRACLTLFLLAAGTVSAQVDTSTGQLSPGDEDRMVTPTPVSGEGYSLEFATETPRASYLRGGLTFGTAYDSNISASAGHAFSDVNYFLWPSITIEQTRPRLALNLSYSPGFTFYRRNDSLNQADHNLELDLKYRLSPHVTLNLGDASKRHRTLSTWSIRIPRIQTPG